MSSLAGKRVLITGAARGIGAGLAEALAAQGAWLALVGLEPDRLAAVAERCGEGTFVAECDVSDRDQVTGAVDAAADALGGLDVVVANAGIATAGPMRLQEVRSWERVIEINLLGVMYTDRAALPHLERSRGRARPGNECLLRSQVRRRGHDRLPPGGAGALRRCGRGGLLPVPGHRH